MVEVGHGGFHDVVGVICIIFQENAVLPGEAPRVLLEHLQQ